MTASLAVPIEDAADSIDTRLADDLDYDAASSLTRRIRHTLGDVQTHADEAQALLVSAYQGRCHFAMGYDNWETYALTEFSNLRVSLPKVERKALHVSMRKQGMSFRAIGEVTGAGKDTVQRDVSSVADETDSPTEILGKDGKTRAAKKPPKVQQDAAENADIVDAEVVEDPKQKKAADPVQPPEPAETPLDDPIAEARQFKSSVRDLRTHISKMTGEGLTEDETEQVRKALQYGLNRLKKA